MNQPLPQRGKLYTGWGNRSCRAERSQRLQLLSGLAAAALPGCLAGLQASCSLAGPGESPRGRAGARHQGCEWDPLWGGERGTLSLEGPMCGRDRRAESVEPVARVLGGGGGRSGESLEERRIFFSSHWVGDRGQRRVVLDARGSWFNFAD